MRAALIVIESDEDYREARARIATLMEARTPADILLEEPTPREPGARAEA